jgi:hypothetical protein
MAHDINRPLIMVATSTTDDPPDFMEGMEGEPLAEGMVEGVLAAVVYPYCTQLVIVLFVHSSSLKERVNRCDVKVMDR